MSKSSLAKRPKESFDPALDAPVALTPDQIESVVGGLTIAKLRIFDGGTTTGAVPPVTLPPLVAY
jgi:hypothetical protein